MGGQFHQRTWRDRFGSMGDEAEGVFEAVYPKGWARYGLNRPPIQMNRLSLKVRYTPDYITSDGLVEVQGFGRDGTVRVKTEKIEALAEWDLEDPVRFFLWDRTNQEWALLPLTDVIAATLPLEPKSYPEGKSYYAIPKASLEAEWVSYTPSKAGEAA